MTVSKTKDPRYDQYIYECKEEAGTAVYKSGPKEFVVYDSRGNIVAIMDYQMARTVAVLFSVVEEGEGE